MRQVLGPNEDSQSVRKHDSEQADVEVGYVFSTQRSLAGLRVHKLANGLLNKLRAFEKPGLAQRLYIAVFMSGNSARTSWMFEDAEEGFTIREPIDRWYHVCKRMAEEGVFRAMDFPNEEWNGVHALDLDSASVADVTNNNEGRKGSDDDGAGSADTITWSQKAQNLDGQQDNWDNLM